ncbi:uncharacterized protein CDAR_473411 [Caerostris darwini]|uniref:Uncharacterized protein n=1 Tax=Caerostris darwini TaxID=1538125 RepID=A0AAV4USM9_9ARAC|nr:uncharacterized protein CDAR_473411 [Caerostris darwini]
MDDTETWKSQIINVHFEDDSETETGLKCTETCSKAKNILHSKTSSAEKMEPLKNTTTEDEMDVKLSKKASYIILNLIEGDPNSSKKKFVMQATGLKKDSSGFTCIPLQFKRIKDGEEISFSPIKSPLGSLQCTSPVLQLMLNSKEKNLFLKVTKDLLVNEDELTTNSVFQVMDTKTNNSDNIFKINISLCGLSNITLLNTKSTSKIIVDEIKPSDVVASEPPLKKISDEKCSVNKSFSAIENQQKNAVFNVMLVAYTIYMKFMDVKSYLSSRNDDISNQKSIKATTIDVKQEMPESSNSKSKKCESSASLIAFSSDSNSSRKSKKCESSASLIAFSNDSNSSRNSKKCESFASLIAFSSDSNSSRRSKKRESSASLIVFSSDSISSCKSKKRESSASLIAFSNDSNSISEKDFSIMPSKSLNFKNNVDVLEENINVYTFDLKSSDIITPSESFNLQPFFIYNITEGNKNSTHGKKDIVYAVNEKLQSIDAVDETLKDSVQLNECLKERSNTSRNSPIDECHDSSSFGTFLEFTSNDKMREERNYSKIPFENVMLSNNGNNVLSFQSGNLNKALICFSNESLSVLLRNEELNLKNSVVENEKNQRNFNSIENTASDGKNEEKERLLDEIFAPLQSCDEFVGLNSKDEKLLLEDFTSCKDSEIINLDERKEETSYFTDSLTFYESQKSDPSFNNNHNDYSVINVDDEIESGLNKREINPKSRLLHFMNDSKSIHSNANKPDLIKDAVSRENILEECKYNTRNIFLLEPANKVVVEESQETNLFGADCKFLSESGSTKDGGNTDSNTFICDEFQNNGTEDLVYENPNSIILSNNDLKFEDFSENESLLKSPEVHESETEIFTNEETHYLNENFIFEENYFDLSLQLAKLQLKDFKNDEQVANFLIGRDLLLDFEEDNSNGGKVLPNNTGDVLSDEWAINDICNDSTTFGNEELINDTNGKCGSKVNAQELEINKKLAYDLMQLNEHCLSQTVFENIEDNKNEMYFKDPCSSFSSTLFDNQNNDFKISDGKYLIDIHHDQYNSIDSLQNNEIYEIMECILKQVSENVKENRNEKHFKDSFSFNDQSNDFKISDGKNSIDNLQNKEIYEIMECILKQVSENIKENCNEKHFKDSNSSPTSILFNDQNDDFKLSDGKHLTDAFGHHHNLENNLQNNEICEILENILIQVCKKERHMEKNENQKESISFNGNCLLESLSLGTSQKIQNAYKESGNYFQYNEKKQDFYNTENKVKEILSEINNDEKTNSSECILTKSMTLDQNDETENESDINIRCYSLSSSGFDYDHSENSGILPEIVLCNEKEETEPLNKYSVECPLLSESENVNEKYINNYSCNGTFADFDWYFDEATGVFHEVDSSDMSEKYCLGSHLTKCAPFQTRVEIENISDRFSKTYTCNESFADFEKHQEEISAASGEIVASSEPKNCDSLGHCATKCTIKDIENVKEDCEKNCKCNDSFMEFNHHEIDESKYSRANTSLEVNCSLNSVESVSSDDNENSMDILEIEELEEHFEIHASRKTTSTPCYKALKSVDLEEEDSCGYTKIPNFQDSEHLLNTDDTEFENSTQEEFYRLAFNIPQFKNSAEKQSMSFPNIHFQEEDSLSSEPFELNTSSDAFDSSLKQSDEIEDESVLKRKRHGYIKHHFSSVWKKFNRQHSISRKIEKKRQYKKQQNDS